MTRLRSLRLVAAVALLRPGGRRLRRALGLPAGPGREREEGLGPRGGALHARRSTRTRTTSATRSPSRTPASRRAASTTTRRSKHVRPSDFAKAGGGAARSRRSTTRRTARPADDLAIVQEARHASRTRTSGSGDGARPDEGAGPGGARVPTAGALAAQPRADHPQLPRTQSLQKILETLGRIAGVNVLFDEGFRDKKTDVDLTGVTFQEALDRLTFVNRLFYKVLDQNTIIIVPESRQKRAAYDELAAAHLLRPERRGQRHRQPDQDPGQGHDRGAEPEPRRDHGARHRRPDRDGGAHHRRERQGRGRGPGRGADPRGQPQRPPSSGASSSSNYRPRPRCLPPAPRRAGEAARSTSARTSCRRSTRPTGCVSMPSTDLRPTSSRATRTTRILAVAAAPGGRGEEDGAEDRAGGADPGHELHGRPQRRHQQGYLPATSFQYRTVGVNLS